MVATGPRMAWLASKETEMKVFCGRSVNISSFFIKQINISAEKTTQFIVKSKAPPFIIIFPIKVMERFTYHY